MTQRPLFGDDTAAGSSIVTALGPAGTAAPSKAQRQFNSLVAKIDALRRQLAQWQAFVPVYDRRLAGEIEPLIAKLHEKRVAMVRLLDHVMDGKALNKRERAKVADLLTGQLADLLEECDDADLVRLYDKYSDVSFEDTQQGEMALLRAIATDAFGVELDAGSDPSTPEELARLIEQRMQAREATADATPRRERKKSAKALAREALREQAAQGATKAVREVYRRLASELHPDREPDPEQRARKTALMQAANRAYDASDLLALLELQLRIEQIDLSALANLAQERLAHYNLVLKEQLQRLEEELFDLTAPFRFGIGEVMPRRLTPDAVQRALDADVHDMRRALRDLEADLARFRDVNQLKRSLKHYRIDRFDDVDIEILGEALFEPPRPRRR